MQPEEGEHECRNPSALGRENLSHCEAIGCIGKLTTTSCGHYWTMSHFIRLAERQNSASCWPGGDTARWISMNLFFLFLVCFVFVFCFVNVQTAFLHLHDDDGINAKNSAACLSFCPGVHILIGVGSVMMFVGFLGCYGAIQESQCLLGTVSHDHT